jgi:glycosyltransferase involved in cell wall biosynthesis
MTAPLVSVVMPVYNGEKYLRDAVESVFAQTYSPIELVAVDDGSSDNSAALLASYGERIVVVRQTNSGVAAARNAGIQAAHGEFIAFLDQDDWWHPEKVRRQVECFLTDPRLGLVHTVTIHFDDTQGAILGGSSPGTAALVGDCLEQLLLGNGIYNSSVMVRRHVFTVVGLLDTTMAGNTVQDYELWLRIAQRFPFGYVSEPMTVWRLHPGQGYWRRQRMLRDELHLLERYTHDAVVDPLRSRLAQLLEDLGQAHLEARESGPARRYFARALRLRPSRRRAAFYALSLLPGSCAEGLCRLRAWVRRLAGHRPPAHMPVWAGGSAQPVAERQVASP